MNTVCIPAPPPPVKLTIVTCNGHVALVEVPYVDGRLRAKRATLEALFSVAPNHCRRANF